MFTDMVGYSAISQRSETLALKLLEGHRRTIRRVIPKYGGREVKTIGDGFLIEFGSALEAAKCALDLQTTISKRDSAAPEDEGISLRIGIHVGDVIRRGKDILGDAVNIASRIQALAEPGGVCISQQVFDQVQNKLTAPMTGMGLQRLKHIKTPVTIFKIEIAGRPAPPQAAEGTDRRVAVLPLANISADPKDEYFADGMTDEIISTLSRIAGLRVIARTSVLRFKGTNKGVGEICRELGVGSAVEGSVRKAGDDIRITVKLIDASREEPVWSQEYDRKLEDVFLIQSDIAQRIAESLRVEILQPAKDGIEGRATENLEAYTLYLRGRYFWTKRTEADLMKAVQYFKKAISSDIRYAPAYAGLADTYSVLALLEFRPPKQVFPGAKKAAERAVMLDGRLGEAYTSRGLVKFQYEWNWKGAEADFRRAIDLNPSYGPAHHFYADFLKAMGRFAEALAQIKAAQEIDPLSLAINTGVGHVLYLSRDYDKAIEQYRKTVELDPNFLQARLWFGRPYLQKGMFIEAVGELREAVKLSGGSTIALSMLAQTLAAAGEKKEALALLNELKRKSITRYIPSYWIAVIYNALEDSAKALDWFERAYNERSSWLVWINVEPRFDRLRSDKRFKNLLKRMDLT